ncbi:hypothetical protein GCM10023238_33860 [Streptomyces heliomycini]
MPTPHRRRGQDEKGRGAAGERLVGEPAHGDQDRDRRRGAGGDDEGARPPPAAQPDPVEQDEGDGGARRMPGDMGGPVVGGAEQDVRVEVPQGGGDVPEAVDGPQVLVGGGQLFGDAPVPAVDEGERPGPGQGRRPRREQQGPPGQPGGQGGTVRHHGGGDDQRGRSARAGVRRPVGQQRRPADPERAVTVLDPGADQDGGQDQQRGGP